MSVVRNRGLPDFDTPCSRSSRVGSRRGPGFEWSRRLLDPPYHSVRRVFPSTAGRLAFGHGLPRVGWLSLSGNSASNLRFASAFRAPRGPLNDPVLSRVRARQYAAWWIGRPPPQGPSLGSGLFCPGPSSLIRPHPPHSAGTSRLHRKAAYTQCLRCAKTPRRPTSGSELSLLTLSKHAVLSDPGEFNTNLSRLSGADIGLRRDRTGSALPTIPQSVSRGGRFRGFTGSHFATAC